MTSWEKQNQGQRRDQWLSGIGSDREDLDAEAQGTGWLVFPSFILQHDGSGRVIMLREFYLNEYKFKAFAHALCHLQAE